MRPSGNSFRTAFGVRRGLDAGGGGRGVLGRGHRARATCWTCCPGWWTSRWWWPRLRSRKGLCATGCWSPSGSTRTNGLRRAGRAERVRERHAHYYLELAEGADAQERSVNLEALGRSRGSSGWRANTATLGRRSPGRSIGTGAREYYEELGLRLAVALFWFWHTHDYQSEGRRYLERALCGKSAPTTTRLRARASNGAGWFALFQADYGASKALIEEALALYRELGDKEGIAAGLTDLGLLEVLGQRDDIPLPAVLEELRELKPQLKNRNTLACLLILEGLIASSRGDLELSVTLHEESLELFREIRDAQGIIMCLIAPWPHSVDRSDYEGAPPLLREALRLGWETDYKPPSNTASTGWGVWPLAVSSPCAPRGCGGRGRHAGGLRCTPHAR